MTIVKMAAAERSKFDYKKLFSLQENKTLLSKSYPKT